VSASEAQRKELNLRAKLSFQAKFKLDSHPRFSEALQFVRIDFVVRSNALARNVPPR
jgi:hypothetical protein